MPDREFVYADHAATSWPKPPGVLRAMAAFLEEAGANAGRSGHRLAVEASRRVYAARRDVARLLGIRDESRVVFLPNATWALNLALYGLLEPGHHVITSSVEHNAVARPLRDLESRGVAVTRVACDSAGRLDPADVRRAVTPRTKMIVMTHASNVTGTLLPAAEVGEIAREYGLLFLLDAAQTAGCYPLHVEELGVSLLAFTGHKSLLGPQGTGGLFIGQGVVPRPLARGGTGSFSHLDTQPVELPDAYESGTLNGAGIAGLGEAARFLLARGVEEVRRHELALTSRLLKGLESIPGVRVYGPRRAEERVAVVSFRVKGLDPARAGELLDTEFGILVRVGLHCAPWAHRTVGTFPEGTVRVSLGYSHTDEEVDRIVEAVAKLGARNGA